MSDMTECLIITYIGNNIKSSQKGLQLLYATRESIGFASRASDVV